MFSKILFLLSFTGLAVCAEELTIDKDNYKVCIGTVSKFAKPSSVETHFKSLKDRYMNCTNIHGNLEITYIVDENADLSFLDNIKEVTGYVLIHQVRVKNFKFPKLQIIRGTSLQNVTGTSHSLLVTHTTLETLELPSLREILHGSAGFYLNTHLNHIETIDWNEILSDTTAKYIFDDDSLVITDPYKCHPDCMRGENGERACWGPGPQNCQKFSKTICSPQCAGGRCFGTKPRECCHLFCAGGCTGPTQKDCIACKNFYDDGVCKEECPPMQRYNSVNYTWEHNPDGRYAYGATCVKNCPEHLLRDNGACVRSCPIKKVAKNGECVPCEGPCPKRCPGSSIVHSWNIENFRNCTVIDGSIRITENTFSGFIEFYANSTASEVSPPMHPDQLEVFSNVKEITGYLDIQAGHKDFRNLSYFRNLEIIHGRILNELRFSSITIVQSSLESLHLKSLKRINAGTVLIQSNKNMCFVDGIDWKSIIKSAEPGIVISTNKEHSLCVAENQTCSDQCNVQGCWGTGSDECVNCKNFEFNGTCIANCSAVANAYMFDNKTCKNCHPECLGCSAYGDKFCLKCMHIRDGDRCVDQCPESKYNDNGVCRPCHPTCHGCTGPRDNIGMGGCNTCSLAIINTDVTIDRCLLPNAKCPDGYYKDFINPQEQVEELQVLVGKSICRKCHPRCEICNGYGFHEQVCSKCKGYKRGEQCEDECPADHYADDVQRECFPCHSECKNCTGPTIRDCMYCRNYKLFDNPDSFNNKSTFSCTSRCPTKYSHIIFHQPSIGPYCCSPPPKPSRFEGMLYSYVAVPAFFIIFTGIVACTYSVRTRNMAKKEAVKLSMVLTGYEDSEPLRPSNVGANLTKLRIVKGIELRKGNILGMGAFGKVYQGSWYPEDESIKGRIPVAIKELLEINGVESSKEFLEEAYIMASVDHPNLLNLLAICMTSQMMLITQLMPLGCLLDYVRNNKKKIGSKALLNWSTQIAKGMSYLEERGIVHRDLAARNVLVQNPSCVKITDFGLAKLLNHDSNEYIAPGGKMPIKWLAIECIRQRVFTSKSDVWAFGVTIWEILTFGQKPYENIAAKELPDLIEQGLKLNQPEYCSLDIYLKLLLCWHVEADMRPTFNELVLVFSEFARDPGRFLPIPHDEYTRLPSYTTQDEKELIRKIARNTALESEDYLQPKPDDYSEDTDVTDAKMLRKIGMGNLKLDLPVDEDDYLMPTCQKNNNTINANANTTTNLGYMDVLATSSPCIDNPEYLFNNSHSNEAYESNIPTQTLGIPIIKSPRTSLNQHEYYNDLQREMQPLQQGGETRV
ncbi:ERBB2.2 family protein [Megaselia abdita]